MPIVGKLYDFIAHASAVSCLKIGPQSARVMVTGGDDRRVNLWAIGRNECIMSLSGHTTPVECVTMDSVEQLVVAGSAGGSIKLWDLEHAKVIRTLSGHRSNVRAVEFHPFGEFFASVSNDGSLKVWDIRRKGCIQTYSGQHESVHILRMSPDGKWIATGGEESQIKLWDLTGGKLLHTFSHTKSSISTICFHPNEFLMATGSENGEIKFWDMETFDLLSSTPEYSNPVSKLKKLGFTNDGSVCIAASNEGFKIWEWEPLFCHDTVNVDWKNLAEFNATSNSGQLVAATIDQSIVTVWVADIMQCRPFKSSDSLQVAPSESHTVGSKSQLQFNRKDHLTTPDFMTYTNMTQTGSPKLITAVLDQAFASDQPTLPPIHMNGVISELQKSAAYEFDSSSSISTSTPPILPNLPSSSSTMSHRPNSASSISTPKPRFKHPKTAKKAFTSSTLTNNTVSHGSLNRSNSSGSSLPMLSRSNSNVVNQNTQVDVTGSSMSFDELEQQYLSSIDNPREVAPMLGERLDLDRRLIGLTLVDSKTPLEITSHVPNTSVSGGMKSPFVPAVGQSMINLDFIEFMRGSERTRAPITTSSLHPRSESELISNMQTSSSSMIAILSTRLKHLRVVKSLWIESNARNSVLALYEVHDRSVWIDVMRLLMSRPRLISLDVSTGLLPLLRELLFDVYEDYITTACSTIKIILRKFGELIKTTLSVQQFYSPGVDINRDEKIRKCKSCYEELKMIRAQLNDLMKVPGTLGNCIRDALKEFSHLGDQ
ncbi:WD40-repeat-containing domain protein [Paraphysoderma sedebokerense]|nr:WD40-repeat-containing domain protein [Paraphysoderma sedebokerense]KAI9138204.1 WD40-repeat-containing domain protein [Paraphysoderma sedebokerense]